MAEEQPKEMTVTLDGKTYKESELPQAAIQYINLRSDMLQIRQKVSAELERCDVMLNYYVEKIKKAIDDGTQTEESKPKEDKKAK
jgi:uncharacterized protein YdeI (YjbR/CyaY-like superfamily)